MAAVATAAATGSLGPIDDEGYILAIGTVLQTIRSVRIANLDEVRSWQQGGTEGTIDVHLVPGEANEVTVRAMPPGHPALALRDSAPRSKHAAVLAHQEKSLGRVVAGRDNTRVIIFEPVIETVDVREFTAWPTTTRAGLGWLTLCGDLAPVDVGTAMAVIAGYNHDRIMPPGKEDDRPSPADLIERIVQADSLIAPGGVRVRDTDTGLAVTPGCCCGLEDWREWDRVAAGQSPWLGHDPAPWVGHQGAVVRVWPDGGDAAVPPTRALPIEIPIDDLPRLIADAHKQFQDFLDLLGPWALPLAGASAARLGPTLATHFRVSWPDPGAAYPAVGDRHS